MIKSYIRHVHTMKVLVMRIGGELIRIACVHTVCALTAICIGCAFGLKANCIITGINAGVIYLRVIDCIRKRAIRKEVTSVMLLPRLDKVLYL